RSISKLQTRLLRLGKQKTFTRCWSARVGTRRWKSPIRVSKTPAQSKFGVQNKGISLLAYENARVAAALIATETRNREISMGVSVVGPLLAIKMNIHGRRIMA